MTWKKDKFKNIIKHKSGYTWSKNQETKFPEPKTVRVLTVTNVQKELDLSSELYLKDVKETDKVKKAVSKHWSIAVSSNGNRKRIGNAVYIKEDSEYLFASFLTAFKPKKDSDILPEYFFRWLKSHPIQERITAVSEGTTGLGNLDIRFLRNMDIEYPENSSEQIAIDNILSKVDEAIEATKNSIKAAEKLKKSLMQNLLTGKLKPDGTWRTEDEFYEDEKFGKVPVGWQVKKVDELVERKKDTIDPVKSKVVYDYVGLEHIAQGEFIRIGKGKSNETLAIKVIFEKGDLLYGKLRPYLNKVWLADISGVGSTEFLVFQKNEFVDWVYLNFQSKRFLDFTQSMTAGTQHPRASWRDVKRYLIIKPIDIDEMNIISNKILLTEKDKVEKQAKIKKLQRLKKSLMQNLITSKVRLPEEFIAQFEDELEVTKTSITAQ